MDSSASGWRQDGDEMELDCPQTIIHNQKLKDEVVYSCAVAGTSTSKCILPDRDPNLVYLTLQYVIRYIKIYVRAVSHQKLIDQ